MGAGHHHSHDGPPPDVRISTLARRATWVLMILVAAVTLAGLIWLWPTHRTVLPGGAKGWSADLTVVPGTVTAMERCPAENVDPNEYQGLNHTCQIARVQLSEGPSAGQTVSVELIGIAARSGVATGDRLHVAEVSDPNGGATSWALITVDRLPTILLFSILFVIAVIAVAGWKGLRGLLGLIISFAVLFGFMIPALTAGEPAVAVALVGSTAIMFVVLYVAHGISMRTTSAFVGTLLSLLATTGLGALGVAMARLSGISTEETIGLAGVLEGLDYASILTCALVIGGLGVLNDTTITQSSTVWELRAVNEDLTRRELFASGMRIGRDHIASTIYTITFAYAGTALTLLLLLSLYDQPLHLLLSTEQFSEEIIRTLGSGIGLILSVPLTTAVAVLTVGGPSPDAGPAPRRAMPKRAR